jgi:hypothetical protein
VWGYVVAPVVLVAMTFLGLGIVSLMIVSAASGLDAPAAVGLAIGVLALLESVVAIRFLRRLDRNANLNDVLRRALDERSSEEEIQQVPPAGHRQHGHRRHLQLRAGR